MHVSPISTAEPVQQRVNKTQIATAKPYPVSLVLHTFPQGQPVRTTQGNQYIHMELVGHEQGAWKQVLSLQFTFTGTALLCTRSALSGNSFRFPGLKGSFSCGGCMAVCSRLVWKKLSTVPSVISMFSSGGPLPRNVVVRAQF